MTREGGRSQEYEDSFARSVAASKAAWPAP